MKKIMFLFSAVLIVFSFLAFILFAKIRVIDRCEKAGGIYLQQDGACVRIDGKGYITNY